MLRVAEHAERTDTGRQRRANEDAYFARAPLFAVADGMGGAQAGEVAAQAAVETLAQGLPDGSGSVEERLAAAAQTANEHIHELSVRDDERAGMGTTLTAVHVGEHELTVVHVGDSRLYRWREGELERLTTDHTLVEELVRQGRLTAEEAEGHPQRSIITRALGPEAAVHPDAFTVPARDGDVYLLCSDGLSSMVPDPEVAAVLEEAPDLAAAARTLVDAANAAGGRDNITVVLLRLAETGGPADVAAETTQVGTPALRAQDVRRALDEREAGAPAAKRRPGPPRPGRAAAAARRRRPRIGLGWILGAAAALIIATSAYLASQVVYFVGTGDDGFVTIYRGVPYELPFGIELYSPVYDSGVSNAQLTPAQRRTIAAHDLRSRQDADDLVRQLELGRLGGR